MLKSYSSDKKHISNRYLPQTLSQQLQDFKISDKLSTTFLFHLHRLLPSLNQLYTLSDQFSCIPA